MEIFDDRGDSPRGILELGDNAQYGPNWGRRQKSVEKLSLDLTKLSDNFANLRGWILVAPQRLKNTADPCL